MIYFGKYLKDYLEYSNISQTEFAMRMGITQKHMNEILNGKTNITLEMAANIERLTGIKSSFIISVENSRILKESILKEYGNLQHIKEEIIKIAVKDENPVQAMKAANEITNVFAKTVTDIYKINNVYTVDEAEEPIVPCNVNHIRDIAIFFIIGLVISVIYVLVSNMFDNTIKDADDIESNSELITLVSIPFVNEDSKRGGIY